MPELLGLKLDVGIVLAYLVGVMLVFFLGRMFVLPLRIVFKLIYNAVIGGIMLWLVNFVGAHIGFSLAINPITALIAGFLGIPGVILLILFKIFIAY